MTAKNMLLIFIFFLLSCKEDDLPKPTQNGSGTFACKLDGKVYTPKSEDFKQSAKRAVLRNSNNMVVSGAIIISNNSEIVVLDIGNFNGEGEYELAETGINSFGLYRFKDQYHYTNATYTGKVKITHFDRSKKIVSGTFDFKAQNAESKEVVHVSEGRFDLYYDEL
jgi:hypothetical protein